MERKLVTNGRKEFPKGNIKLQFDQETLEKCMKLVQAITPKLWNEEEEIMALNFLYCSDIE